MFATYLHPETRLLSRPVDQIQFQGHSYPHFARVAQELAIGLAHHPSLPLREAPLTEFNRVHAPEYLAAIQQLAAGHEIPERPRLSLECAGLEHCLPAYCYGLGGFYEAVDQMRQGRLQRAFVFSLAGHHAYRDWGHGYCLLNPLAVAVRYAQQQGFNRVLIVDWDIHHGDGTQAIFARDPNVHQISIHSGLDLYMLKAAPYQTGSTAGGQTDGHCNIPVLHYLFDDASIERLGFGSSFYRAESCLPRFEQALHELPFTPDLIFIFAGADGHKEDCGAGITDWTFDTFRQLTRMAVDASRRASCPIISVQGGGYKLPVTVASTLAHVEALSQ